VPELIPISRPQLGEDEIAAAVRVLRSGQLTQGPEVAAFEEEFAGLVDGRHCIAVNSGTAALWLSLLALGIGPGDDVIVPSFTFAATAAAVRLTGATCVFADIDPATFCLDPAAAAAAITPRTAAVIPVHLYGHPADTDRLIPLARSHALAVVEDAAQAHAATLHARPVGTFGSTAAFSFYPTKNMHTIGGGMVTTADPALARTLRLLRNHGMCTRYTHEIVGTNARMSDVAAAVGRVQLSKLPAYTLALRRNAHRLDTMLRGVLTPPVATGAWHVYHQYTIRVPDRPAGRRALLEALHQRGIGAAVYYPTPVHRMPAYRSPPIFRTRTPQPPRYRHCRSTPL
jgi:dTDP-4-amino-4,6-dideoxygalactose transaminase